MALKGVKGKMSGDVFWSPLVPPLVVHGRSPSVCECLPAVLQGVSLAFCVIAE